MGLVIMFFSMGLTIMGRCITIRLKLSMESTIPSNLYTEAALNLICLKGKGNKRADIMNLEANIIYIEK